MWTLFTQALSRGSSSVQVTILNTSTNFVLTALLGLVIFAEKLPPMWWVGAFMLVAGNVIIGRKNETRIRAEVEGETQSRDNNNAIYDGERHPLRADNGYPSGEEQNEDAVIKGQQADLDDADEHEDRKSTGKASSRK